MDEDQSPLMNAGFGAGPFMNSLVGASTVSGFRSSRKNPNNNAEREPPPGHPPEYKGNMKARIVNAQTALLAAGMIALFTTLPAHAGAGGQQNPGVLPPDSSPFGASYSQWSERWWQWVFSLPVGHHPLFDTADVSAGQSGQVWFLGGNFTGKPETRNVTIPAGIALFFPVLNRW